jgi:hypothetical protein
MAEDKWYVVPELEVRIHETWITLIDYCNNELPYGDLKIQLANALPTKRLKATPKIRFDKPVLKSQKGTWYIIPSTGERVHEYWINFIQWCQNYFTKGTVTIRLVAAQPTELLSAEQDIRFDKPDTIPNGPPITFNGD